MFQVLQQECVAAESLDEVDSLGKTLLDRLTTPVIFPDGYAFVCKVIPKTSNVQMDTLLIPKPATTI